MSAAYRGRFAPTPSGPLHFGSLVAAVASYLEARCQRGEWWLRIDDLDGARVQPGAAEAILRCLDNHGLRWDGPVIFQSRRLAAYHAALHRLRQRGLIYACACSRAQIARQAPMGIEGPVYPGTCRRGLTGSARAWRVRCDGTVIRFDDAVQGQVCMDLDRELGDFVLYRSDGVYAFHLASAVDDADFGMTHIVRGVDLLPSSVRQQFLLNCLGLPVPHFAHLPVVRDASGEKLSKQTHAPALDESRPVATLVQALVFLGQAPPAELGRASLATLWQWAITHWRLDAIRTSVHRDGSGNSLASSKRSAGST